LRIFLVWVFVFYFFVCRPFPSLSLVDPSSSLLSLFFLVSSAGGFSSDAFRFLVCFRIGCIASCCFFLSLISEVCHTYPFILLSLHFFPTPSYSSFLVSRLPILANSLITFLFTFRSLLVVFFSPLLCARFCATFAPPINHLLLLAFHVPLRAFAQTGVLSYFLPPILLLEHQPDLLPPLLVQSIPLLRHVLRQPTESTCSCPLLFLCPQPGRLVICIGAPK